MPIFFKIAGVFLIPAFVLCLFLGVNGHISRENIEVPFGLFFVNVALEAFVSSRGLLDASGGPDRAGTPRWKATLILFCGLGVFVVFMGASPLLTRLTEIGRLALVLGAIATVLTCINDSSREETNKSQSTRSG